MLIGCGSPQYTPFFAPITKEKRGGRSLPAGWLLSVNFYFTVESVPSLNIFARSIFILPTSQNRHSSHAETIPATIIIMAVWKYVNMKFGVKIYSSKRLSLLFAVCICPLHKKSAFIDYQKAGHRHTAPMARLRPILGSYFLPAT